MNNINIAGIIFFILFAVCFFGWIFTWVYYLYKEEQKMKKFLRRKLNSDNYLQLLEMNNEIRFQILIKEKLSPEDYKFFKEFIE